MVTFLPTVMQNLFSSPATRLSPRKVAGGVRGKVRLALDNCLYCGLCQRRCPAACLTVNRQARTFVLDASRCILCGACTEACPKHCLAMEEEGRSPVTDKRKLAEQGLSTPPAVA
jgi:formate hydrogenlyase subunit 6/NADH:ubiquinone oxidoreductase subunit I